MNEKRKVILVDHNGQIWQGGTFTKLQIESYKRKYRALGVYLSVMDYKIKEVTNA